MNYIVHFFESIAYNLQLFFFAPAPFTHVFKIALVAQIVLLIVATLRPQKWKWITLFTSEIVFCIGGIVTAGQGLVGNDLFMLGYGSITVVLGLILLFITLGCSLRTRVS